MYMYFGSYHSSLFLVGFPGYSSSASETDSASLADVPVSSTSFDRDRRPAHLLTRTGGSLYSQMRLSLMLAVKGKRSSWSWTGTLFCCVLRRCNSHPLTTATLSPQTKIQQYQSLWSEISILFLKPVPSLSTDHISIFSSITWSSRKVNQLS